MMRFALAGAPTVLLDGVGLGGALTVGFAGYAHRYQCHAPMGLIAQTWFTVY